MGNSPHVVVVGAQGTGKSALGYRLKNRIPDLLQFETGEVLREIEKGHRPHPKRAEITRLMHAGELISDDVIMGIAREWIEEHRSARGHLYNGLPRNPDQAAKLLAIWKEFGLRPPRLILINASKRVIEQRVLGRRVCPKDGCKAIFNIFLHPPKDEGRCDRCGSGLIQREDDSPEALAKRLDDFYTHTMLAVEWLRDCGLKYYEIDGEQPLDYVERKALEILLNGSWG